MCYSHTKWWLYGFNHLNNNIKILEVKSKIYASLCSHIRSTLRRLNTISFLKFLYVSLSLVQRETPRPFSGNYGAETYLKPNQIWISLQIYHKYSTLKRRGNGRFHAVSTWSTCGVFVRILTLLIFIEKSFFWIFKKVFYDYLKFSPILFKLNTSVFIGSGFRLTKDVNLTCSRGVFMTKYSRMD